MVNQNPGSQVRFRRQGDANIPEPQQEQSWQERLWRAVTPQPIERAVENWYSNAPAQVVQPRQGAEGISRALPGIYTAVTDPLRNLLNNIGLTANFLSGRDPRPGALIGSQILGASPRSAVSGATKVKGIPPAKEAVEQPTGQTVNEWLAANMVPFDGSPYDRAADYMLERRQAQLEAVQNMYNQYAEEAAANAARVADIYGGAQQGIGETYTGSAQAIEDAYASAQQQAADQMARLGIQEAAPAVVNPMALSQAESLAGVEAGRAAGLGAIQRYGATGRDFASSMAQIAQQQAVEQQDRFTSQLADQLFELEMQRAQAEAAYDPYSQAIRRMELEQAFYEPQLRAMEAQSKADSSAAELQLNTTLDRRDKIIQVWTDIREDYETDEEAMAAAEVAVSRAEQLYPIQ